MTSSQEAWRQARAQIAEFEAKSGELSLVLQSEKDKLTSVEKEVASLAAERGFILAKAEEAEAKAAQARKQLEELSAQAAKAAEESEVLTQHLDLLRRNKQEMATKLEQHRQQHAQQLDQLTTMLELYRRHLSPEQTAET